MNSYNPIRKRMVWVGTIQTAITALTMSGLGTDIINGIQGIALGVVNVLVLAGVLVKGTKDSEKNTTPVSDTGEPLNPEYERKHQAT